MNWRTLAIVAAAAAVVATLALGARTGAFVCRGEPAVTIGNMLIAGCRND